MSQAGSSQYLRMLHLSNLQFSPASNWRALPLLDRLIQSVAKLHREAPIQLVMVSGDIVKSGQPAEFEAARDWFQHKLRPALGGSLFPLDHFLFVPGNQDVRVDPPGRVFPNIRDQLVNKELDDHAIKDCFDPTVDDDFGKVLRTRHAAYLEFARSFSGDSKQEAWWSRAFEFDGVKLGVAGLASSWFCGKSDDRGKLALGLYQLNQVLESLEQAKPQLAIAMLHHPLDFMTEQDQGRARQILAQKVPLVLHGHPSKAIVQSHSDGAASQHWLAAGSVFSDANDGQGFQLLEWGANTCLLTLTPYLYKDEQWIIDRNQFPDSLDRRWISKIGEARPPSKASVLKKTGSELDPLQLCPGCFAALKDSGLCGAGCRRQAKAEFKDLKERQRLADRYLLGLPLGERGSFGWVYLAWDESEQTRVAIKEFFPSELGSRDGTKLVLNDSSKSASFAVQKSAFYREVDLLDRLEHPQLVKKCDFFEENETAYLVMAYREGMTLAAWLAEQATLSEERWAFQCLSAVGWLAQLLEGLAYLHGRGFIHRDIKPANIYLARLGQSHFTPILLDFGFSRPTQGQKSRLGTEGYAAPEQLTAEAEVDERADLYGIGATLYEILTRKQPPSGMERWKKDRLEELHFSLAPGLSMLIRQAMAREKEQRPASAEQMRTALEACLKPGSGDEPVERARADWQRAKEWAEAEQQKRLALEQRVALVEAEKGESLQRCKAEETAKREAQDQLVAERARAELAEERVRQEQAAKSKVEEQAAQGAAALEEAEKRLEAQRVAKAEALRQLERERGLRVQAEKLASQAEAEKSKAHEVLRAESVVKSETLRLVEVERQKAVREAGDREVRMLQGLEFAFRWIPSGSFTMGSPPEEEGRNDNEVAHRVCLSRGLWLMETAVTREQFRLFVSQTNNKTTAEMTGSVNVWNGKEWVEEKGGNWRNQFVGDKRPVVAVSWEDAQAMAAWLSEMWQARHQKCRLPTEAEWEYACRAGTQTALYTGGLAIKGKCNGPELDKIAWYAGNSGVNYPWSDGRDSTGRLEKQYEFKKAGTRNVGEKAPNAWGLYDMLGNVWEWCRDWYGAYPGDGEVLDPAGPSASRFRVIRGGSWSNSAKFCRSAGRISARPAYRSHNLGFRLALGQS